ncbi:hypothetical protein CON64_09885 [Bacillus pseudomycoides]|nr:hypothetical protein CON64_09885 [Bacillus pseudomycoides]
MNKYKVDEEMITKKKQELKLIDPSYDFKNEYLDSNLDVFTKWLSYRKLSNVDCDASLLATIIFNELWKCNGNIYKQKGSQNKYQICTDKYVLRGDSMTSLQTSLKKYIQLFQSDLLDNGSVPNHKNMNGSNTDKWIKFLQDNKNKITFSEDMIEFISLYSSIGNMLPVPIFEGNKKSSFNTSRSNFGKFDYTDLMLLAIFSWYEKNDSIHNDKTNDIDLQTLFRSNEDAIECCKTWLKDFSNWEAFVENNYLQDFVEKDTRKPIMLWEGHSFKNPIPQNQEEMNKFLSTVNQMIKERGNRILERINL